MTTTTLVCVGDSFTEGMSDELRPDGHHVGWSDRAAHGLAVLAARDGDEVAYANLAVRGKLLDQVVADQLPVVERIAPTITTFHAGPNDVLRRGTDLADLYRRYDAAVARTAAASGRTTRAGPLERNARVGADQSARAIEFFRIPPDRVVELGMQLSV